MTFRAGLLLSGSFAPNTTETMPVCVTHQSKPSAFSSASPS